MKSRPKIAVFDGENLRLRSRQFRGLLEVSDHLEPKCEKVGERELMHGETNTKSGTDSEKDGA